VAIRTSDELVRGQVETVPTISTAPFIRTASHLTDKVAANDSNGSLSASDLLDIETMLACYYYTMRDPLFMEKKTGDASGKYQSRSYWEEACRLDTTGFLRGLDKGKVQAEVEWLGLPPSEQTDVWDRD